MWLVAFAPEDFRPGQLKIQGLALLLGEFLIFVLKAIQKKPRLGGDGSFPAQGLNWLESKATSYKAELLFLRISAFRQWFGLWKKDAGNTIAIL